ncbi:TPA: tRNA(Met) cytidine acetyltransferase, partial [Salmonella enterica]|nr:tRNA(Met) cytidine acetyltransferase [Salmonella enterica]
QAGSWLLLLMPPYETWESRPDTDSLRWSDCAQPIPTPQFAQHLKRTLSRDPQTLLWRQRQPFCWPSYPSRERWRPATGEPQPEQAAILSRLREMPPGVATVIAPRGRGKSALAGQFISQMAGTAIVTAPAKTATDILAAFAGERFCFMAPDALLASGARADWLVVDE